MPGRVLNGRYEMIEPIGAAGWHWYTGRWIMRQARWCCQDIAV